MVCHLRGCSICRRPGHFPDDEPEAPPGRLAHELRYYIAPGDALEVSQAGQLLVVKQTPQGVMRYALVSVTLATGQRIGTRLVFTTPAVVGVELW